MALLSGIALAKLHGQRIWIEMDAEVVVKWRGMKQLCSEEVCSSLAKVRQELRGIEWTVSHIYREGNKAADYLAGLGMQASVRVVYSASSAPP